MDVKRANLVVLLVTLGMYSQAIAKQYVETLSDSSVASISSSLEKAGGATCSFGTIAVMSIRGPGR